METIVDLDPEAYRMAKSLAAERGQSLGKVLGDALLGHHASLERFKGAHEDDEYGWPVLRTEHPIATEEIKSMIAEDEEWEITRGDPNHPWYSVQEAFEPGYPRVAKGPFGLPELQLRPPFPLEKGEA